MAEEGSVTTPKKFGSDIHLKFKVKYRVTNVRKIMRRLGMSVKASQKVHASRPAVEETRKWQQGTKARFARLEPMGFVTPVLDKDIFNDPDKGVKHWSPRGVQVITTYKGSHDRVLMYGALTTDGRQFVRTYGGFDKDTFLKYLKALIRHFDRVTLILDSGRSTRPGLCENILRESQTGAVSR